MEPRVRRATRDDAREIARVHVETWRTAYAHVFPAGFLASLSIDDRAARWEERLAQGSFDMFVAELDGRVVGWACSGEGRDEDANATSGELYGIYVEPSAWSKGAGRALVQQVEEALAHRRFDEATLWVLEDNPRARAFYESAGWAADGARKLETFLGVEAVVVRYATILA